MRRSRKRFELGERHLDLPQDPFENIGHLEVPIYPTSFNRYRSGPVNLHVHFGLRRARGNVSPEEWCAVLKKPLLMTDLRPSSPDGNGSGDLIDSPRKDNETAVLIRVVEGAEESEECPLLVTGRVVGLQRLDDCNCLAGHSLDGALETAPPIRITDEIGSGPILLPNVDFLDGEAGLVPSIGRGDSARKVIESRPEVVQEVAQNHGKHRVRLLSEADSVLPDVRLSLRLPATFGPIWVCLGVPPHVLPKR